MNVFEALHCSGCGRRLGLEPLSKAGNLSCPDCAVAFEVMACADGKLHDCPSCGGQFVEHRLLQTLLQRQQALHEPRPIRALKNPLKDPVRYIKCPICTQLMHRKNFGRTSGVILDVCHAHGTWFDTGELPLVLKFVAQGGLLRAQALAAEERRLERSRAQASQPRTTSLLGTRLQPQKDSRVAELAEAVLALLQWLVELTRD